MTARTGIFISYRREDSAGDAGRLADHLQSRFRHARVFLDVDAIAPGTDFTQVLRSYLDETAAVLVVIGPRWMSPRSDDGKRRLDDTKDFVRFEVEAALTSDVLVVPVLVQGATMPRAEDLPPSLASLVHRQGVTLDHAEFHSDAERLCKSLAKLVGGQRITARLGRRWWLSGAALAAALAAVLARRAIPPAPRSAAQPTAASAAADRRPLNGPTSEKETVRSADSAALSTGAKTVSGAGKLPKAQDSIVETLLAEAGGQRRRNQLADALATLARAHERAPASTAVRDAQQDIAMQWIREAHVANGTSSFGEAIKPATAIVDAALPSATGVRRADLLAHEGWATFLLWRDGNRQLDPTKEYREALAIDPGNPYANAMLAHWSLGRDQDLQVAVRLFAVAARSRRDIDAVRALQWGAYKNADTPEAGVERVRLADAMRRGGEKLSAPQRNDLLSIYSSAMRGVHDKDRQLLLAALPADDHISTLVWAFEPHAPQYESGRDIIRYYVALLNASAGRVDRARDDLEDLDQKLTSSPGSLRDAVRAALQGL